MKKTVSELWEEIFIDLDIITNINNCGYFKITADDIRKYKEPRLMTKFDFSKQLPKVFKENQLGILPIKNGEYIIGKYNLFQNTDDAFSLVSVEGAFCYDGKKKFIYKDYDGKLKD